MSIVLAQITDQAAATLSAALMGAIITGSVALVVFSTGQYLTWRLETTKHLRQKLEDLLAAMLTIQTVLARVPKSEEMDHLVFARQVSDLSSAKVQCEAIQRVYFPEASTYMSQLGSSIDSLCVEFLRLPTAKKEPAGAETNLPVGQIDNPLALHTRLVLENGENLLNYLSADQAHLTRLPCFLNNQKLSGGTCKCTSP